MQEKAFVAGIQDLKKELFQVSLVYRNISTDVKLIHEVNRFKQRIVTSTVSRPRDTSCHWI